MLEVQPPSFDLTRRLLFLLANSLPSDQSSYTHHSELIIPAKWHRTNDQTVSHRPSAYPNRYIQIEIEIIPSSQAHHQTGARPLPKKALRSSPPPAPSTLSHPPNLPHDPPPCRPSQIRPDLQNHRMPRPDHTPQHDPPPP